jgi:hypothetical protein
MPSLSSAKQLRTAGTAMEKESGMGLFSGAGSMMSSHGQGAQLSFWTMAGELSGQRTTQEGTFQWPRFSRPAIPAAAGPSYYEPKRNAGLKIRSAIQPS